MKKKKLEFAGIFCLIAVLFWGCSQQGILLFPENEKPIVDLIGRILSPEAASHFAIEFIADENGKDVFEIESSDDKIILRGNNGISVASAFNYYLNYYLNLQFTWNTSALKVPKTFPQVTQKIRKVSPYKCRYYLNYCTFNYTMSWWDWERWQREIDWMALHGINMPLALIGQNAVWQRVYREMGFSDGQLAGFFSGPAYFNWFWMGNLDGWGGPLPQSWMASHEKLQKQILEQERAFGMTPVLPAFTGHVPPEFQQKFPDAKVKTTHWSTFPKVNILDPSDSLFTVIGQKFMEEMIETYGTDHLYSADTFNENRPPSNEPQFLKNMSAKVYESMVSVDADAKWIMQGWLFHFQRDFWKEEQVQALLDGVPDEGMILLDLWSEKNPMWAKTNAYYGKPWIWCMLHNFGGNTSLYGQMDHIAEEPIKTLQNEESGNMLGIGLTPEAIEQNPVVYELMLDNIWEDEPIDVDQWLPRYVSNRYGKVNETVMEAWQILRETVYADSLTNGGTESIIVARPTFNKNAACVDTKLAYDTDRLVDAWTKMVEVADEFGESEEFRYDLVDLSRQVLADYGNQLQQNFSEAYKSRDYQKYNQLKQQFLVLLDDMDRLLATRQEFLLGNWLETAKAWGTTPEETAIYEQNARNLITLWGDEDARLHEYSWRHWSGLISHFYKVRWQKFFADVEVSLKGNKTFSQDKFEKEIASWEWSWVTSHDNFPTKTNGDEIEVIKSIYKTYQPVLKEIK